MDFTIVYGNHGLATHIEDNIVYVRNGLRAAGHQAYLSPQPDPRSTNIVLENFSQDWADALVRRQAEGLRVILVGTEFTDGKTFNAHQQTGGHYGRKDYWQERFDLFRRVSEKALAVWCYSIHQVAEYGAICPHLTASAIPRAFDPLTEPAVHPPPERKDIDLLFSGGSTDYRRAVIERLGRRFKVLSTDAFTPNAIRTDLIVRAKANLHINHVPDARFNSVGRNHFLLMHKGPVLSERVSLRHELDDFIIHLDSDHLDEQIAEFLSSGQWRTQGERAYDAYRAAGELGPAMAALLDRLPG